MDGRVAPGGPGGRGQFPVRQRVGGRAGGRRVSHRHALSGGEPAGPDGAHLWRHRAPSSADRGHHARNGAGPGGRLPPSGVCRGRTRHRGSRLAGVRHLGRRHAPPRAEGGSQTGDAGKHPAACAGGRGCNRLLRHDRVCQAARGRHAGGLGGGGQRRLAGLSAGPAAGLPGSRDSRQRREVFLAHQRSRLRGGDQLQT